MERAVREGLSVRQLESFGREHKGASENVGSGSGKSLIPHQPWIAELESRLRESLGTRVAIQNSKGYRGKIVIDYFDRATLERLCQVLAPTRTLV
jgi:ParB-like chromosome segregation protein Spo0J